MLLQRRGPGNNRARLFTGVLLSHSMQGDCRADPYLGYTMQPDKSTLLLQARHPPPPRRWPLGTPAKAVALSLTHAVSLTLQARHVRHPMLAPSVPQLWTMPAGARCM